MPHADLLTRFVDAIVERSDELSDLRDELIEATDEATMIDSAATVAAFEMMTRIADGTGTTQPSWRLPDMEVVRDELGLDDFESARLLND